MRSICLALIAFSIAVSALAADWPHFLGPAGNGISPEKGINKNWTAKPPKELWRVALSDNGFSGPAVAGGRVFIVDHKGDRDIVRALDLATGADAWQYAYQDTANTNAGYGYTTSTPAVDNGKVYTLSHLGVLNCLEAQTGKLVWSRNLTADFGGRLPSWNLAVSPFIDGDRVIVTPGGNEAAVAALNKLTGETIWKGGGSDIPGYATPAVAVMRGVRQYVVFTGVSLLGVDAQTGAQLWRLPWKAEYNINAASPLVSGDYIIIATGYGSGRTALVQIKETGPEVLWTNPQLNPKFNTPIVMGGNLFTTTERNTLYCADARTGAVRWSQKGFELGGLCAVDGVLLGLDGANGDVVMFSPSPDAFQELGRIKPLGGMSWTAPIVADGKLLVRNQKALVCLDMK